MNNRILMLVFIIAFGLPAGATAQQNTVPDSIFFDLNEFFDIDLENLLKQLQSGSDSSFTYFDPFSGIGMMDSIFSIFQDPQMIRSFDKIFTELEMKIGELGGLSDHIDEMMKQFRMPFNMDSLMQKPIDPGNLDGGGWRIIPDIPKDGNKKEPASKKELMEI